MPAEWLLDVSDGVPRRVHELASRWARREAARRVDAAAGRTAAGRAELRSMEAELTGGVIELQAAREDAASAGEDDAPVRCPFKGLASFEVADAPYFFGRERLVAELVARLVGASLLGVVGPSGSGKSSVVRAGLLPALAGGVLPGSADWERVVMRPGEHPLRELASATARSEPRRVAWCWWSISSRRPSRRVATRPSAARSSPSWSPADDGGRIVVLAIRADYYGRCGAYPELSRLLAAHHVLVSAMRRDELRRAVERPAQRVGLRVEPELTDALVADVEHEPGALPMLSTALLELWQRRDGRRLRLATYEATGGVRGAVARHAEEAFARLDRDQQALARSVLLRLAAEDAGGTIERRRIALAELDDDASPQVVAVLTDQRLLTVSAGAVELAHEALLREWPRLRGWLEEDAEGRRLHRRLGRRGARVGRGRTRRRRPLPRRAPGRALEWRARHEPELNRTERAFLDASRGAEQRELHAARARRRRAVALGIAVLVVITGISSILAVRGIQRARYEQRAAASRALATRALARLPDNVALAGSARRSRPTVASRRSKPAAPSCPSSHRSRRTAGSAARSFTESASRTWRSAPTDARWPPPPTTGRSRSGTWPRGDGSPPRAPVTTRSTIWRSAPTAGCWLAVTTDAVVQLWDVARRRPIGRPFVHPARHSGAWRRVQPRRQDAAPAPAAAATSVVRTVSTARCSCGTSPLDGRSAGRSIPARRPSPMFSSTRTARCSPSPAATSTCSYGTRRPVAGSPRRLRATTATSSRSRSAPTVGRWPAVPMTTPCGSGTCASTGRWAGRSGTTWMT